LGDEVIRRRRASDRDEDSRESEPERAAAAGKAREGHRAGAYQRTELAGQYTHASREPLPQAIHVTRRLAVLTRVFAGLKRFAPRQPVAFLVRACSRAGVSEKKRTLVCEFYTRRRGILSRAILA